MSIKKFKILIITLILAGCSSNKKIVNEYKKISISELKNEKENLEKQLSYYKLSYYNENIKKGKTRQSLALVWARDNQIRSIIQESPNYSTLRKQWSIAVDEYIKFENKYSPEIKKHRNLNYESKEKSLANRKKYNNIYLPLQQELKNREPKKHQYYESNLIEKLINMWYDGGDYLLNYFKSRDQKVPLYWLITNDLNGIQNKLDYRNLIKRSKYIEKKISRK